MENILGQKKIENYIEDIKDSLYIEDNYGRLMIYGNYNEFKIEHYISGIPIAIKGILNNEGNFLFDDFLFYDNINDININEINYNNDNNSSIINDNKNMILFIANLNIGKKYKNEEDFGFNESIRTLLIEFIQNRNNININLKKYSEKIKRIILVGNSVHNSDNEYEQKIIFDNINISSQDINKNILDNYMLLNKFLNYISNFNYIDLMSSIESNDNLLYPQNPLNKILFTENNKNINFSSLKLVSNPYIFNIKLRNGKNKYFIGTSGENINIIKQYSSYENIIDIMKKNLEWRHLCPINPNYLNLYSPDNKSDPLILQELPDVYFTTSEKDFQCEKIIINNKKIILLSLPDFSKTNKCVLYNYEEDEYKIIEFKLNI